MQNQNEETKDTSDVAVTPGLAAQDDYVRKIVDKIKTSENVLIALTKAPSVDEISAAIALTIFLDNMQHHVTAVFSGKVPESLNFLSPETIFETNTSSLQDFIIALSKEKADHLRYKLEGDYVKVFITPYKTEITEKDLSFMKGDYNVDFVIGINVKSVGDLDNALVEEGGKILHSASAVDITCEDPGRFGEIEWSNKVASSVCEMMTQLIFAVQGQDKTLDPEVATALLTGIVAATQRFSNNRTTPQTLTLASKLMELGADQQLITANIADNTKAEANFPEPELPKADNAGAGDFVQAAPVRPKIPVAPSVNPVTGATQSAGPTAGITVKPEVAGVAPAVNPAAQMAKAMPAAPTGPAPATFAIPNVAPDNKGVEAAPTIAPPAANNVVVTPNVPGALPSTPAAPASVNAVPTRPIADSAPSLGERPAQGVPIKPPEENGPKDYGAMMDAALAEPLKSSAVVVPVVPPVAQAGTPNGTAGTGSANQMSAPTNPNAAISSATMAIPTPTKQPVARPETVIPPAPQPPTSGPDMMPPSLPPVQVPPSMM